jgi:hypothetical protein
MLLKDEEIKWYQRDKVKDLLEDDSNTKYFQFVANGKHRKIRIYQLLDSGHIIISGDTDLEKHITIYYTGFSRPSKKTQFSVDENRREDIPHVSQRE